MKAGLFLGFLDGVQDDCYGLFTIVCAKIASTIKNDSTNYVKGFRPYTLIFHVVMRCQVADLNCHI
jgi:hypothetical protein